MNSIYQDLTDCINKSVKIFNFDFTNYVENTYQIFTDLVALPEMEQLFRNLLHIRFELSDYYRLEKIDKNQEYHKKYKTQFIMCFLYDYNSKEFVTLIKNINKLLSSKAFYLNQDIFKLKFSKLWYDLYAFEGVLSEIAKISNMWVEDQFSKIDKVGDDYMVFAALNVVTPEIAKDFIQLIMKPLQSGVFFNMYYGRDYSCDYTKILQILILRLRKRYWMLYKRLKALNASTEILNFFHDKFRFKCFKK